MYLTTFALISFPTGIGLNLAGTGYLPDNSIIVLESLESRSPDMVCASESIGINVGSWIAPSGDDITTDTNDPFTVTFGGSVSPAFMRISQVDELGRGFSGVYSCQLPDAGGETLSVNVGIFLQDLACE